MFNGERYINAGTVEIYRYGKKAIERVKACMKPNKNGFYGISVDGDKYWAIGTNEGRYGEFMKFGDTFFSVNSMGIAWAKEGTAKAEKFLEFLQAMVDEMNAINEERLASLRNDEEESEETEENEETEEVEEVEENENESPENQSSLNSRDGINGNDDLSNIATDNILKMSSNIHEGRNRERIYSNATDKDAVAIDNREPVAGMGDQCSKMN